MKILFISNFLEPDYLNDCFYNGLATLQKKFPSEYEVTLSNLPEYMLDSYPKTESLYGRGFSLYGYMDHHPRVSFNCFEEIINKQFDIVIYGSIRRDQRWLEQILSIYDKDSIICLDGEDHAYVDDFLAEKTRYYKREILDDRTDVLPISFAIPKEKVFTSRIDKSELFAHTTHEGGPEKYTYTNEYDYYISYAQSYYGTTSKKGGWDCLRHYEILASYCLPHFVDIAACPPNVLTTLPKKLLLQVNEYADKQQLHPNYDELLEEAHQFTLDRLTTEALVTKVLG